MQLWPLDVLAAAMRADAAGQTHDLPEADLMCRNNPDYIRLEMEEGECL